MVGEQSSAPLQKTPSSQRPSSTVLTQPPTVSEQESRVQLIPSLQFSGVPDRQLREGSQISMPSQTTPLSQLASLAVLMQPAVGSQVSSVQAIESEQSSAVPG